MVLDVTSTYAFSAMVPHHSQTQSSPPGSDQSQFACGMIVRKTREKQSSMPLLWSISQHEGNYFGHLCLDALGILSTVKTWCTPEWAGPKSNLVRYTVLVSLQINTNHTSLTWLSRQLRCHWLRSNNATALLHWLHANSIKRKDAISGKGASYVVV